MKVLLKLLAPIMPFITDFIWLKMYGKESIHLQLFEEKIEGDFSAYTPKLVEFNSLVWKKKKEEGISLKDSISMEIPKELKIFERDLKAMHNLKTTK
jgi:valyl-tRNA synthetase